MDLKYPARTRIMVVFTFFFILLGSSSCAHLSDTCDTYCIRHGGQCAGVDYGTRRYNTATGDYKEKPTYFNCKFIN